MMTLTQEELAKKLKTFTKEGSQVQMMYHKKIIKTFRNFWKTNPDEKMFSETIAGLLLQPEMLYIMVKEKQNGN